MYADVRRPTSFFNVRHGLTRACLVFEKFRALKLHRVSLDRRLFDTASTNVQIFAVSVLRNHTSHLSFVILLMTVGLDRSECKVEKSEEIYRKTITITSVRFLLRIAIRCKVCMKETIHFEITTLASTE